MKNSLTLRCLYSVWTDSFVLSMQSFGTHFILNSLFCLWVQVDIFNSTGSVGQLGGAAEPSVALITFGSHLVQDFHGQDLAGVMLIHIDQSLRILSHPHRQDFLFGLLWQRNLSSIEHFTDF